MRHTEWDFGGWGIRVDTSRMSQPVRCRCGNVYDLGKVKVTARYTDCSMWRTPCCKQLADDRPAGWSSSAWFERLS